MPAIKVAKKYYSKRTQHARRRASCKVSLTRLRSFPIGRNQPPRLPPSEVCQRGPPST